MILLIKTILVIVIVLSLTKLIEAVVSKDETRAPAVLAFSAGLLYYLSFLP